MAVWLWRATDGQPAREGNEKPDMRLMLKDCCVLNISENGVCEILDFHRLPFALRREGILFPEFVEWAINRTLSISRSYAKELLNFLRLPQTNGYEICKVCRGLTLEDSYWIKQEEDEKSWEEVNLFQNELSLFLAELALSGSISRETRAERETLYDPIPRRRLKIHTPELTTLGASAKGWIRGKDGLYLHKVGKYELAASQILEVLKIPHILYEESEKEELSAYITKERKEWLEGVGEKMVKSRLFTNEAYSLVTFEEFSVFCGFYGRNPYIEAEKLDRKAYLEMQVADYLLNNDDRHGQNWGFFMENSTGKLTGYCPLFDHDHAFSKSQKVMSQTTKEPVPLEEAAIEAQKELKLALSPLFDMEKPPYLEETKWEEVLERGRKLRQST